MLCYASLARRLGADQPFYGLQARGIDGREPPRARIEDMAADYVSAIRAVQPSGPYHIGGWSFGGIVAFEVAQQLRQTGEEVAHLALIDSGAPVHGFTMSDLDDATMLAWFARDMGWWPESLLASLMQRRPEEQLRYILERAESEGRADAGTARTLLEVFKANWLALRSYVPKAYPHKAVLYRCRDLASLFEAGALSSDDLVDSLDRSWGWSKVVGMPVEVHELPGDHFTILTEPDVGVLADLLKGHL